MTPAERNIYAIEYLATQTDPAMKGCTAAMFADTKATWLKALRVEGSPQTQSTLCDAAGFCCLGILAMTIPGTLVLEDDQIQLPTGEVLGGDLAKLPSHMFWSFDGLGIGKHNASGWNDGFDPDDPRLGKHNASGWNDEHGKTFLEIADLIEKYVYGIPVPA
jgi:hypothetical protein